MPFCPICRCEFQVGFRQCPDCAIELVEKLSPEEQLLPFGPLVTVYIAKDMSEAMMIKSLLQDAQIEALAGYDLGPAYPIGQIEVRVPENRAEEARELIEEFERTTPLLEEDPGYY